MPKARGQPSPAEAKMLEMRRIFDGNQASGDPATWVFVAEAPGPGAGRGFAEEYRAARQGAGLPPLSSPGLEGVGPYFRRDPQDAGIAEKLFFHYCKDLASFFAHPENLGKLGLVARQFLSAYAGAGLVQGLDPRVPPVLRELQAKLTSFAPGRTSAVTDVLRLLYNRALAILISDNQAAALGVRRLGPGGQALTAIGCPPALAAARQADQRQVEESGRVFAFDAGSQMVREQAGTRESSVTVAYEVGACYNVINALRRSVVSAAESHEAFSLMRFQRELGWVEGELPRGAATATASSQGSSSAGPKVGGAGWQGMFDDRGSSGVAEPLFRNFKGSAGAKKPAQSGGEPRKESPWGNLWEEMRAAKPRRPAATPRPGPTRHGNPPASAAYAGPAAPAGGARPSPSAPAHSTTETASAPGPAPRAVTTYEYSSRQDDDLVVNLTLGAIGLLIVSAGAYVLSHFMRLLWLVDHYGELSFPFSVIAWYYHWLLLLIFQAIGALWWVIKLLWNTSLSGYPKVDVILSLVMIFAFLRLCGFVMVQPLVRFCERGDRGWMLGVGLGAIALVPGLLGWVLTVIGWFVT
jgi:hypothetical protein